MNKPNLVQRGKVRNVAKIEGIDSLVDFDYMGSAEFEFGSLPKALKEICTALPTLGFKWTNIQANGKNLWLLCKPEDELPLADFWNAAVEKRYPLRLQESLYYGELGEYTNFWWDIGAAQCWMAALGEDEIQKVYDALVEVKKKKGW